SSLHEGRGGIRRLARREAAEAALALLVLEEGDEEVPAPEVRPQHGAHRKLRVGYLPEEEVREAHLAAGPHDEVGVGLAGGVQAACERLLVEILRRHALPQEGAAGTDHLRPPAL